MYAATPEALEAVLAMLDALRQFIADDNAAFTWETPYFGFLKEKGYGAATFTGRLRQSRYLADQDQEEFHRLANFWRQYLAWKNPDTPITDD